MMDADALVPVRYKTTQWSHDCLIFVIPEKIVFILKWAPACYISPEPKAYVLPPYRIDDHLDPVLCQQKGYVLQNTP